VLAIKIIFINDRFIIVYCFKSYMKAVIAFNCIVYTFE